MTVKSGRNRTMRFAAAIAMLSLSGPCLAAADPGLQLANAGARHEAGLAVTASWRLNFGETRQRAAGRFALAAGTELYGLRGTWPSRHVVPLFELGAVPGYGADLRIAGAAVASYRTRLGAAEDERQPDSGGGGLSTGGWLALGAGVALVGGAGLLLDRLEDVSD
jgi:hypothetical protein